MAGHMMLIAPIGVRSRSPVILVDDQDTILKSRQSYEQSEAEPGHLFDSVRLSVLDSPRVYLRQNPTEAASQRT